MEGLFNKKRAACQCPLQNLLRNTQKLYAIKVQSFPNCEIRAVIYPARDNRNSAKKKGVPAHLTLVSNSKPRLNPVPSKDSKNKKAGHGRLGTPTKFGNNARRRIIRAGAILDQYPPSESLFCTATLPGSTDSAFRTIAEYSSYAINLIQAWIAKHHHGKELIYVWELQKRGALHLHFVLHCGSSDARNYLQSEFKNQWNRILSAISLKSGIDLYAKSKSYSHKNNKESVRTKAEIVTKSVARYLSKYLSKSKSKGFQMRTSYSPVRWFGVSRPLSAKLKAATREYVWSFARRGLAESRFEEISHAIDSSTVKSYSYVSKVPGSKVVVGYYESRDCGHPSEHIIFKELTMQGKITAESLDRYRLQLTQEGINLLRLNGHLHDNFIACIGHRFPFDSPGCATLSLDRFEQEDFINSLNYTIEDWQLTRSHTPGTTAMQWIGKYRHYLSGLRKYRAHLLGTIDESGARTGIRTSVGEELIG
uniref:Replication-associated protein ORF2/G2P domain-containing protein n=1 Tax=uncultured prokaryote TaxID=198431 RepID=A0A0H5Q2L5_9ZZZZ|nr:hypothetical protein [uncultured prokaryote]